MRKIEKLVRITIIFIIICCIVYTMIPVVASAQTDTSMENTSEQSIREFIQSYLDFVCIVKSDFILERNQWNDFFNISNEDIVQLYSDGLAYHSMIVVLVEFDPSTSMPSDLKIAQHTTNGYYWLSTKPSSRYYRIIRGSYT